MEKIFEKAKELGIMISESKEFAALKEAEANHMADKEAVQIMMDYSNKQQDIQRRASVPDITKEELSKLIDYIYSEYIILWDKENYPEGKDHFLAQLRDRKKELIEFNEVKN